MSFFHNAGHIGLTQPDKQEIKLKPYELRKKSKLKPGVLSTSSLVGVKWRFLVENERNSESEAQEEKLRFENYEALLKKERKNISSAGERNHNPLFSDTLPSPGVVEKNDYENITDKVKHLNVADSVDEKTDATVVERPLSPVILWRNTARVKIATDIPPELMSVLLSDNSDLQTSESHPNDSSEAILQVIPEVVTMGPKKSTVKLNTSRKPKEIRNKKPKYGAWHLPPTEWKKEKISDITETEYAVNVPGSSSDENVDKLNSELNELEISKAYKIFILDQQKPNEESDMPHYLEKVPVDYSKRLIDTSTLQKPAVAITPKNEFDAGYFSPKSILSGSQGKAFFSAGPLIKRNPFVKSDNPSRRISETNRRTSVASTRRTSVAPRKSSILPSITETNSNPTKRRTSKQVESETVNQVVDGPRRAILKTGQTIPEEDGSFSTNSNRKRSIMIIEPPQKKI